MQLQIIDDNSDFAKTLCEKLINEDTNITCNEIQLQFTEMQKQVEVDFINHTPVQISRAIFETYGERLSDNIVFFINVNLLAGGKRQEQKGIDLLIWLRIKKVMNHVVLYSFETIHTLLNREPKHLIATSIGTTFVQIPSDFSELNLEKLCFEKAEENNLKQTLNTAFDVIRFRHTYANVWGLIRLLEVHEELRPGSCAKLIMENKVVFDTKIASSIEYNIAEFLFVDKQKNVLTEIKKGQIIKVLEELENIKKERNGKEIKKILLIDDRAIAGWKGLLSLLMPKYEVVVLDIKDNIKDLINEFELHYKEDEFLMVILDLRLLPKEEHEHDYTKFLSVQLLQKMLDKKGKYRDSFKYPYLKFLLFTASNQLKNMLDVMYRNDYTPFRIFIKEGFDINQRENQKYESYLNLLYCLQTTAKENYRGKPKRLESFQINEQNKIDFFYQNLNNGEWKKKHDELIVKYNLKEFTHIVLDTNIFSNEQPILPLTSDLNIVLSYPVYKELKRWTNTREQTYRKFCAEYFLILYENSVDNLSLENKKQEIDELFASQQADLGDAADGYFKDVLNYYQINKFNNILFVTNDKRGKNGKKSPVEIVNEWIASNNITNVKVLGYDHKKNELINTNLKMPQQKLGERSVPPLVVNQNFQKHSKPDLIVSNSIHQKKINPKLLQIKWKDCTLDENQFILNFKNENEQFNITIGKKNRYGFVAAFSKLSQTDNYFEFNMNNYSINGLSTILLEFKK
jgi:hypothetical protein